MAWRMLRRAVGHYRELVLAGAFVGMASYELLEMRVDTPGGGAWLSLPLVLHAFQVAVILGATWAFLRAWRDKTASAQALARMVEKVVLAQEDERRRIAYEVHDGIAQLIVSAKQHLDTALDIAPAGSGRMGTELVTAANRLERAIVETRRVLVALRPPDLDSLGLVTAARQSLAETAERAGWTVRFEENLRDARLPAAVETAAYRILQEALANASRHARAPVVEVALRLEPGWLVVDVHDDGVGLPPPAELSHGRGLGLASMQERARLLGGRCTVERAPRHGTRVQARLPLVPAPDATARPS
jgi:signal transduction histidine kinase